MVGKGKEKKKHKLGEPCWAPSRENPQTEIVLWKKV